MHSIEHCSDCSSGVLTSSTHGDHTYPAETGYASHPAHSKNNGPLGNHGAVTGYHKAAPVATVSHLPYG